MSHDLHLTVQPVMQEAIGVFGPQHVNMTLEQESIDEQKCT